MKVTLTAAALMILGCVACGPTTLQPRPDRTLEIAPGRKVLGVYCELNCYTVWVLTRPAGAGEQPQQLQLQPFDSLGRDGISVRIQEQ
jgi:hypothetical protein